MPHVTDDMTDAQKAAVAKEQAAIIGSSWGDKFKRFSFGAAVDVAINYVINTLLSVLIAYNLENRWGVALNRKCHDVARPIAKYINRPAEKLGESLFSATKGISLTFGGTALVPVVKHAKDRRHEYEFKIGHALDVMQDKLGMGNAATEENLREYDIIKKAVATGKKPDLPQEDIDRFKTQHHVESDDKGKYDFKERKASWGNAVVGRALAWGAAGGTNFSLQWLFGFNTFLASSASSITKHISKRFPSITKLAKPNKFSELTINDMVLTVSAAATQAAADRIFETKDARTRTFKRHNQIVPVEPAPAAPEKDMEWAKKATSNVIADAQKKAESHQAQVAESRSNATQTALS